MLPSLRLSTRAARAATPQRWIERTSAGSTRLLSLPPRWIERNRRHFSQAHIRCQHEAVLEDSASPPPPVSPDLPKQRIEWRKLPLVCPGCGAHSQTVDKDAAGYYGEKRRKRDAAQIKQKEEDDIFAQALQSGALKDHGDEVVTETKPMDEDPVQICDRCHLLLHNGIGSPIIHPSMQSIQAIIEESPHEHNNIYHVLDAADFPMSLIPNLQSALHLPRLRTQNRRSKSKRYDKGGRVAEVSFIITRSDLLAPQKEQVDKMMHYLQECLRDALGRSGRNVRLGNVRCVSSQRGWWTKNVKEDIYRQGGAAWMVGKANVGKSALFEVVFPKNRGQKRIEAPHLMKEVPTDNSDMDGAKWGSGEVDPFEDQSSSSAPEVSKDAFDEVETACKEAQPNEALDEAETALQEEQPEEDEDIVLDEDEDASLLPPAQPETAYPHMPLVSSLPGTTASPIRVPFGRGKGELIDLPGIHRSSFDAHIKPEHRNELVMKSRVTPEQYTVKPGQSLLLGGTIRITPKTEDLIFLMYPFVPASFGPHVTANDKAIAIQTGVHPETQEPYSGTVSSLATEAARKKMASAGTFKLEWDVTRRRAGPVTGKSDGNIKPENLPFTVYSADLLIESVGWVELVAQVRSKQRADAFSEGPPIPEVEVFSPKGRFVGLRRPMNAWLLGGQLKKPVHVQRGRPRQTVSYQRRKAGGR